MAIGAFAATAAPVAAAGTDSCSNAAIRAQQGASGLADCRAYELVSPADKGGSSVFYDQAAYEYGMSANSPDGEAAVFFTYSPFPGSTTPLGSSSRAKRSAGGWQTETLSPTPVSPHPDQYTALASIWDMTDDFETAFASATLDGVDPDDLNGTYDAYMRRPDGSFVWLAESLPADERALGSNPSIAYTPDGSHVAFERIATTVPLASGAVAGRAVYVYRDGVAVAAGVDSNGDLLSPCGASLGEGGEALGTAQRQHAISSDGSRVFVVSPSPLASGDPSCNEPEQIYMRADEQTTVHISRSRLDVPEPTRDAAFVGASEDGSKVLITTAEKLTESADPNGSPALYLYDVATDGLEFVGRGTMRAMADDGSRVYLSSSQPLTPGEGVPNMTNLYVYSDSGLDFIVTLGSGDAASLRSTLSPDGSQFGFVAASNPLGLDPSGNAHVYWYDAATGGLQCASCLPGATPATGPAYLHGPNGSFRMRRLTDDGRVFFTTAQPLVGEDTDGRYDVYEYDHGEVRQIAAPGASESILMGISDDGEDVFFATSDALVGQDRDNGDVDIYDARVGGGFPYSPPAPVDCAADDCQGARSGAPALPAPDTRSEGTGNARPAPRARFALRTVTRRQLRGLARTGGATLAVRVNGPGRVSIGASARIAGRTRAVAHGSRSARRAGIVRVPLRLSKPARRALARRGRLGLTLRVGFSKAPPESIALQLRASR